MLKLKQKLTCDCGDKLIFGAAKPAYIESYSGRILCDVCCKCVRFNENLYACNDTTHDYFICVECAAKIQNNKSFPLKYWCQICDTIKTPESTPKCHYLIGGYMRQYCDMVLHDIVGLIYSMYDGIFIILTHEYINEWSEMLWSGINYYRNIKKLKSLSNYYGNDWRLILRMNSESTFKDVIKQMGIYYGIDTQYINLKIRIDNVNYRVNISQQIKEYNDILTDKKHSCQWSYIDDDSKMLYSMEQHEIGLERMRNNDNSDIIFDEMYLEPYAVFRCQYHCENHCGFLQACPQIRIVYKKSFEVKDFIEHALSIFQKDMFRGELIQYIKNNDTNNIFKNNNEISKWIKDRKYIDYCLFLEYNEDARYNISHHFEYPNGYIPSHDTVVWIKELPHKNSGKDMELLIEYYREYCDSDNQYYRFGCDVFHIRQDIKLIDFLMNEYLLYNKRINKDILTNKWLIYRQSVLNPLSNNIKLQDMGTLTDLNNPSNNLNISKLINIFEDFHLRIVLPKGYLL